MKSRALSRVAVFVVATRGVDVPGMTCESEFLSMKSVHIGHATSSSQILPTPVVPESHVSEPGYSGMLERDSQRLTGDSEHGEMHEPGSEPKSDAMMVDDRKGPLHADSL